MSTSAAHGPRAGPERSSVRSLLLNGAMRVLEARFHPRQKDQPEFIVVGSLVWSKGEQSERPIFQPSNATSIPDATVIKLRYLLAATTPDSFRGLQSLRSQFWSFVEVPRGERS